MVDDVELKACPHCGTTMHQHEYCFSHPKPATGYCILRHYSFDNSKREAWNTRTPSPVSVEDVDDRQRAITLLDVTAKSLAHQGRLDDTRKLHEAAHVLAALSA
jgi:hypothetical protein